eukprot:TRINITY_DN2142_c1_g1_i1.p1 TRINITY_DN2142_c1_g1~~TRINITY_DN2142_c1_g1_i1.p1  ORF type:complete len:341 (+),score=89.00 TRINITY_DN2142_c1_g1_i1:149-1171(+)
MDAAQSSGSLANLTSGDVDGMDPKTTLNHFCQRFCKRPVTKNDIAYTTNKFGHQYQSIVKLDCIQGQEYAGHLCLNQKEADKSAAQQAIMAFMDQIDQLPPPNSKDKKKKTQVRLTAAELAAKKARQAEEGDNNPAITPKTRLNALVMKITKRYLKKGETVYETRSFASGGHQATVQLKALPDDWTGRVWAGHVCTTKQKAEQSAAEIALEQIEADEELQKKAAEPKGMGKGMMKGKGKGKGFDWFMNPWDLMMMGGSGPNLPRMRLTQEAVDGQVVEWKGSFGWVKPTEPFDHPAAKRREGKIYASSKDVKGEAAVDAKVKFHIYEDPQGLGAEEIEVV